MVDTAEYIYCNGCGYEDFDVKVGFSRTTANGDWWICPLCKEETGNVSFYEDE